jgi:hypothetical protein
MMGGPGSGKRKEPIHLQPVDFEPPVSASHELFITRKSGENTHMYCMGQTHMRQELARLRVDMKFALGQVTEVRIIHRFETPHRVEILRSKEDVLGRSKRNDR